MFTLEKRETKFLPKIRNIILSFIFLLLWITFIGNVLEKLEGQIFNIYSKKYVFFLTCILAPLWEELVFRVAPIQFAKNLGEKFILPTIIISSAIFGLGHPNSPNPILYQGVMGVILSFLYIKNNYSYWSAVLLHFMWNLYIFLIYF